jgi:hypothetical protein
MTKAEATVRHAIRNAMASGRGWLGARTRRRVRGKFGVF